MKAITIHFKIKRRRKTNRIEKLTFLKESGQTFMKHPELRLEVDLWDVLHLWKIHATFFLDAIFKFHETDLTISSWRLRCSTPLGTVFNSMHFSIHRDFIFGITPFSIIISFN
jgi:hypothetical protein